ncbi:hypothetical protein Tco_0440855, partial [Tanacetum coccineum]
MTKHLRSKWGIKRQIGSRSFILVVEFYCVFIQWGVKVSHIFEYLFIRCEIHKEHVHLKEQM